MNDLSVKTLVFMILYLICIVFPDFRDLVKLHSTVEISDIK